MSEQLSVGAALIDLRYFREHYAEARVPTAQDIQDILAAAEALAQALERVQGLQTSRIGASDHLQRFHNTPGELDNYSFYAGVSFALAKVSAAIRKIPT